MGSKGYRQHSQFVNAGYYDDDIDTDDYQTRYRQKEMYNDRINGGDYVDEDEEDDNGQDRDSDWSEDEQLGVADYVEMPESKPKGKKKKKKKKRKQRENEYDVSVNDVDSMPIHSGSGNDAIEVQIHSKENADYDQFCDQNETL